MNREFLLRSMMGALAALAIVLGVQTMAFAASSDCTGVVKWNGSSSSPLYMWKLNGENQIIFCPNNVICDDPSKICHASITIPTPPSTTYTHFCDCDDSPSLLCTTQVSSNSPWGPITAVDCIGECPQPQDCELTTISPKDPNGFYDARCECR